MYSDNIFGWFNEGHKDVYDIFIDKAKDGDKILEIGCFLGKSSMYLAEKIKISGKDIKLYCVDLFSIRADYPGNDKLRYNLKKKFGEDLLPQFKEHILNLDVNDIIIPFKMKSSDAYNYFIKNNIRFDYIFIDGGHDYEVVKEDIEKSLIIINENGIIGGDDYFTSPKDDKVQKAVDEIFKDKITFHKQSWLYYS